MAKAKDSTEVDIFKEDEYKGRRRLLSIYDGLLQNKRLNKKELCEMHGVNSRTIERDIATINAFLLEKKEFDIGGFEEDDDEDGEPIVYKARCTKGCYEMNKPILNCLEEDEAFAVIKMMLEDRGLNTDEMKKLVSKIVSCCIANNRQAGFRKVVDRELVEYKGPRHNMELIKKVWSLQQAIDDKRIVNINYKKLNGSAVKRKLIPVGIIFNEMYFYLLAFIKTKEEAGLSEEAHTPAVYRVDRMVKIDKGNTHFTEKDVRREEQCSEAEIRRRVPFMYMGPLQWVKFECKDEAVEAVLDKLPSAEIRGNNKDKHTTQIFAKVYGRLGVDMWLRAQGDAIIGEPEYGKSVDDFFIGKKK